jgi:hypothetical protein
VQLAASEPVRCRLMARGGAVGALAGVLSDPKRTPAGALWAARLLRVLSEVRRAAAAALGGGRAGARLLRLPPLMAPSSARAARRVPDPRPRSEPQTPWLPPPLVGVTAPTHP